MTSGGLAAVSASAFAALYSAFGKYDVVHIHAEGPAFFSWLPKMFGKRVVVTIHGVDWQREKWQSGFGSKFIRQGEKNAVKYADEIIVLSKGVQDYFKETYGRETHFIPNGVNRPRIRETNLITEKFGLKKDSYILFLGRLVPEKGIRYLVEAFKNVKTDKKLVIAGGSSDTDSFMAELKELAKDDNRILFTGFVQGAMLDELYSNLLKRSVSTITKLLVVIFFVLAIHDEFMTPFFEIFDNRLFGKSIELFYPHPTYLAAACIVFLLVLATTNGPENNIIYMVMVSTIVVFTFRAKAISFVAVFWGLYLMVDVWKIKNKIIYVTVSAILAGYLAYDQFIIYFMSKTWSARAVLFTDAITVAKRYFPIGAGFASFGTNMSVVSYSPLYYEFGYNNIEGIEPFAKNENGYGTDSSEAIELTNYLIKQTENNFKSYRNMLGGKVKFGLSSPGYLDFGKNCGATLDGRKADEPFQTHISRDKGEPLTEIMNFESKLQFSGVSSNANVLDVMVPASLIKDNISKFAIYMKGGIKEGISVPKYINRPILNELHQTIIHPSSSPTLRSASGQGERPRRKPRAPDAPRSGMLKHIKINAHKSDRVNMIILKHKIAKNLENNAETWYNFGTNKPVLVRQRYAVVL